MSRKYYTIQIIPENTTGARKFRISNKQFVLFNVGLVLVAIILILFIVHIAKINKTLANYEKMRVHNAQLVKQNANYEELFSRLDSLWIMENRIQNIFETFLEITSTDTAGHAKPQKHGFFHLLLQGEVLFFLPPKVPLQIIRKRIRYFVPDRSGFSFQNGVLRSG